MADWIEAAAEIMGVGLSNASVDGALTLYYKVSMSTIKRTLAVIELLLVFPAALFKMALFLREVQPLAQTGRLVEWFSHHVVLGLYVALICVASEAMRSFVKPHWRLSPLSARTWRPC